MLELKEISNFFSLSLKLGRGTVELLSNTLQSFYLLKPTFVEKLSIMWPSTTIDD